MEEQPCQRPTLPQFAAIDNWSKSEKYDLWQALKAHGSHDIEAIHELIPTKTPNEIELAISHFKKRALSHRIIADRKRKEKVNVNTYPRIPLASWAKYLTDSLSFEDLQTETANALRLIAEFENIPSAICTGGYDFREIYHLLANAVEGKALPFNAEKAQILDKCIVETALLSKAFHHSTIVKGIVENVDISDKETIFFPRQTSDLELRTLLHLASQRSNNPLNIGEDYLKASPS